MKPSTRRTPVFGSIFALVLLAAISAALLAAPYQAFAQHPVAPMPQPKATSSADNPATAETPKSEEQEENGFLNAPMVYKTAHWMGMSEPTARDIFLIINFAIIFFAIAIPLTRTMPKVFRRRSQTLRHSLELARQASEEARQRLSAVEARLAGLDREIAGYRAQMEREMAEDEQRVKATLKEESERIVSAAELEINAASAQARRGLRALAADLAIDRALEQIRLTPEADRELIHEFIGQLGAPNSEPDAVGAGEKK